MRPGAQRTIVNTVQKNAHKDQVYRNKQKDIINETGRKKNVKLE